jgi:DNA-directed RNA polymerase specialized sigma subunit
MTRELRIGKLIECFPAWDPLPPLGQELRVGLIDEALKQIPKREAFIIKKLVLSNWTRSRIACHLRISRSRVSQLVKQAWKHLGQVGQKLTSFN